MKTTNASHGMWKIDRAAASCSSPPAPTPKYRGAYNS